MSRKDSIYRSSTGRDDIRGWCLAQLAEWPVPHERIEITANDADTHVVTAGSGAATVVFVPGGLTRLRLTPGLLAAWVAWSVRPAPTHSAWLLRAMLAPGGQPREQLVEWMTLVAQHSRSSRAPNAADLPAQAVPRLILTGAKDVFLPPRKLGPAVRRKLGTDLGVIAGAGHLVVEERPKYLASLISDP